MDKASKNYTYDTIAQKLTSSLKILSRLLLVIGKPFFALFTYFVIGVFFILVIVKQVLKASLTGFLLLLIEVIIALSQLPKMVFSMYRYIEKKMKFAQKKKKEIKVYQRKSGPWKAFSKPKKLTLVNLRLPKLKIRYIVLFFFFYFIFVAAFVGWKIFTHDIPSPDNLAQRKLKVSTKIYDRNGVLLYNIYKDENRTPVSLDQVLLRVRLATLAIEDAEFYEHPGFSIRGVLRAIYKNYKEGELTGGSTITQQLVKNTLLTPEKTYTRKLKEIILAIQVEHKFSKDQILEMYLNEVSYGGTAYGIQEAARVYFAKDVDKLTLAEAALLAGLPKSPTRYSPFGTNPDLAFNRQKEVLNLMKTNGFITQNQLEEAQKEKITFAENRTGIKAPHFVMYAREYLENIYGKEVVETGGLEVITTLDYQIQQLAERVVQEEVESLKKLKVTNGAAIVINPQTGEILAMVGSRDYFDTESDGNVNVALRPRQPGSSIKIVNYAYALSNNYTSATILEDTPISFLVDGQPPYTPKNYDGRFRGHLTLRSAFAESRNVPAVKVLASYGVEKMIEMGRKMGITTWKDPSNYGLSLTLGGGEVKLIDLAQAYATVANYGTRPDLSPIQKVTNYQGKVLGENSCSQLKPKSRFNIAKKVNPPNHVVRGRQDDQVNLINQVDQNHLVNLAYASESALNLKKQSDSSCLSEQVLDPRIAYMLTDILKDNSARTPAFGANSLLNITNHKEVAVKTGTSNDLRDNWAIGFNQNYLVAVWVGNNDNSEMSRVASGITGATPIFNKIMSALLANKANHDWIIPDRLVRVSYCTLTGTLPCLGCPTIRYEWFLQENAPTKACSPEVIKQILEKQNEKDEKENESTPQGEVFEPAASTELY